jgi:hypothetical protein
MDRSGKDKTREAPAAGCAVVGAAAGTRPTAGIGSYLALAFAILCLMVLRKPDTVLNPQFWAEDCTVLFWQALTRGWSSVFLPYNGFLWIPLRVVAVVASPLRLELLPFVYNFTALAIEAACCALFSLPAYRHLVRNDWLRRACCLLFACALPAGGEMIGTLTNLHWYLALAALAALAARPARISGLGAGVAACIGAGVVLCGLSCPVLIVATPIALWQAAGALRSRDWKTLAIRICLLAGILIEVNVSLIYGVPAAGPTRPLLPNLPMAIAFPGVLRWILGTRLAQFVVAHAMIPAGVAVWLALLAWLVWSLCKMRLFPLVCVVLLFIGPVAEAIVGRHILLATWDNVMWAGERYFFLSGCAFFFWMAASIERWLPAWRYSPIALVGLFGLGIAGNFRVPPYPELHWPAQAARIREWRATGRGASLPVLPADLFSLELPGLLSPPTSSTFRSLRVKPVDVENIGPAIPIRQWKADSAWTVNGFHPSVGTLPGEALFGSYSGSDANQGVLLSAPFGIGGLGCIVLPVAHGPTLTDQFIFLIDGGTKETLGEVPLDPKSGNWRYWAVHFRTGVDKLRILAEDRGRLHGEWVAVGEPHWCKP